MKNPPPFLFLLGLIFGVSSLMAQTNTAPDVGELEYRLGKALYEQHKWGEARTALEAVPKDHPQHEQAQSLLSAISIATQNGGTNAPAMPPVSSSSTNSISPNQIPGVSSNSTTNTSPSTPLVSKRAVKGMVTLEEKVSSKEIRRNRSNIVVWLTNDQLPPPAPSPEAQLEQKGNTFIPHVLAVSVGSTVKFPNGDGTFHNVFSSSETKAFDLGLYKKPDSKSVTFDKPGLIEVYCNIHQSMTAYVWILPTSFFAVTGPDGKFDLRDIPHGSYHLHAWHERAAEELDKVIEVNAATGDFDELILTDHPELANKKHLRKDGTSYGGSRY